MPSAGRHIQKILLLAVAYFLFSLVMLGMYVNGDQESYRKFYNEIYGIPFSDIAPIAISTIGSAEPLTWFVLWVGSNLAVDKNIWISFLNVFLITGIYRLLNKYNARRISTFLVLTNFYVFVLMTGAERLKISYILLVWAFVFEGRIRFILALLSPLAHLQSFILLASVFSGLLSEPLRRLFLKGKLQKGKLIAALSILSIGGSIFIYVQDAVLKKASGYANRSFDFTDMLSIGLLMIIGLLVSRERLRMVMALIPLFFAVAVLGGGRVNMIAVSVFLGLLIYERLMSHVLITIILLYFTVKSIPFIINIFKYGNGFGSPLL